MHYYKFIIIFPGSSVLKLSDFPLDCFDHFPIIKKNYNTLVYGFDPRISLIQILTIKL